MFGVSFILFNVFLFPGQFSASPLYTNSDSSSTVPKDHFSSKKVFSEMFGQSSCSDGGTCFSRDAASSSGAEVGAKPSGLCFEKIGNGSFLNFAPHPDGSDQIFLGNQHGKVWLASVPPEGLLELDESNPFLDITDQVLQDPEYGVMGMAFHPNFTQNGRMFMSYYCDKLKQTRCNGICTCNTDINCDPARVASENGVKPCQYHNVIAEFSANGTGSKHSVGQKANPSEVRRIFTMGLPLQGCHVGQILFGPEDGYLYFMTADGSRDYDPYNFSQTKRSMLGKILRLDVDNIPSEKEIHDQGFLGNYSIPSDNPYIEDKELAPEIWAYGFRNPWRCSFDSERPSYFLCGDNGQDLYEEIDLIVKGGNYGWHMYEGPYPTPVKTSADSSIRTISPVMGYKHSEVDKTGGSASITGGYYYRSMTDPCMYGRYLYMDLYGTNIWIGQENPENSGNFATSKIDFGCADDSPIPCVFAAPGDIGNVFTFGEDNRKDIYILASSGVYRVTRPSRCHFTCAKENKVTAKQLPADLVSGNGCEDSLLNISLLCSVLFLLLWSVIY